MKNYHAIYRRLRAINAELDVMHRQLSTVRTDDILARQALRCAIDVLVEESCELMDVLGDDPMPEDCHI